MASESCQPAMVETTGTHVGANILQNVFYIFKFSLPTALVFVIFSFNKNVWSAYELLGAVLVLGAQEGANLHVGPAPMKLLVQQGDGC